jgi:NAD+ kinase
MKLYICANGFTEDQLDQAKHCIKKLRIGHECSLPEELGRKLFNASYVPDFAPEEADLIISLGGDGALLAAARVAIAAERPLIGINSGRLGYLCAMSFDDIDRFDEIIAARRIRKVHLLELSLDGRHAYALNDIIVAKHNFGKTVDLKVTIEGYRDMNIRGDGIIICTPVGSTAYNLSAGGPELDYDADVFALTPICAHNRDTHCRIVSGDKAVSVSVNHESALVYADGELIGETSNGAGIARSDKTLELYF